MAFGSGGGLVDYKIRVDVSDAVTGFETLEAVLLRYLVLMRQMNLPEDQEKALIVISQMIVAINSARLAMKALMVESGPAGILFLSIGLMMSLTSGVQTVDTYLRSPKY